MTNLILNDGWQSRRSGFGNGLRRLSARDLPYNALSTARRQPGILMHVHPVLPRNLKLQQPQLPRSEPDGQPTESSQLAHAKLPDGIRVSRSEACMGALIS
jgi:hypothetical protein